LISNSRICRLSRLWQPRLLPRRILVALVQTGVLGRLCPKAIAYDRAGEEEVVVPTGALGRHDIYIAAVRHIVDRRGVPTPIGKPSF